MRSRVATAWAGTQAAGFFYHAFYHCAGKGDARGFRSLKVAGRQPIKAAGGLHGFAGHALHVSYRVVHFYNVAHSWGASAGDVEQSAFAQGDDARPDAGSFDASQPKPNRVQIKGVREIIS